MNKQLKDIQYYITRGEEILKHPTFHPVTNEPIIKLDAFTGYRTTSLSYIQRVYGTDHSYYSSFANSVVNASFDHMKAAIAIFRAMKDEVENSRGANDATSYRRQSRDFSKTKNRLGGLPSLAFWGIILTIIGGAFTFGLLMGQTKFDQVKIDLSTQNTQYKSQNTMLQKELDIERKNTDEAVIR